MIRRPPRSTLSSSSAASDVYKRQTPYISVCMGIDDVLQGFAEFSECIHSFFDHVFAIHRLPQLQSSFIQLPKVHYSSPIRLIEPRVWLDVKSRSRSLHLGCSIHPSPFACGLPRSVWPVCTCLLYTSDAADEEDSVDLGGRRIIKKK